MVSSKLPVCGSQSGRATPREGDILGMPLARCRQLQPTPEAIWSGRAGTRRSAVAALARTPHIHRSQEIATERHGKSRWGRGVFSRLVLHLQEGIPEPLHPVVFLAQRWPAGAQASQVPSAQLRCPAAVPSCPAGAARRTSFPSIPSIEGLLLVLPTEESAQRCPEIEAQLTSAEPLPATTFVVCKPENSKAGSTESEDVRRCDQQWGFAQSHVLGVAKCHALCLGLRKSG